ncbi:biorientation of chromosomes in cell division protein 1-like 1 isoform X1 [Coccinella septempunctata]|uniref:biorientation of chromosomes in cell division protein 1-like 1 isoform X1 n=1 Tax=Coccinella septempunctata TaxID=41139 RepID=UPI001D07B4D5|nr:biorientation of chromosomes in cell division protein 1-like 1 isoform X1 [Coccinella septempunctata]
MDLMCNFLPGDPRLVEQIVKELKSQGIFDQFRKECISDVDTKPAYQNLRQRVEGSVTSFLNEQTWTPDMNKNQVREMLRKHIHESGFLETGVERIVDQVVNPKINTVFIPKVDDVMYKFLGIERPKEKSTTPLEINTVHDLLPNDLEAVSPELPEEKDFPKEEIKEIKVEEMSPRLDNNDRIMQEENSIDSQSSILSAVVSHDSNNSLKQDSVMSLNSSESRMSLPENTLKLELEDICLSQKSSDSNSKTEILSDEKISENNIENKEEITNAPETFSEKTSEETKHKSKDGRRDKYHSSSDRSKSRSDKERDKSRSDKPKTEEKDGKTEEKKYKIPKLTDKNKDSKPKDKEDKPKSDKGKSDKDHRSDKDKKYDKDRKSKHSSEKDSSSSEKKKKDKAEKKDDRRDKKESSRSDKSRDDKRSSSSKKRDSQSSKDSQKEKDKEGHIKSSKEETSDKSKKIHSSSSSKKDSKSRKDDDKYKSSHKKEEKNEKDERKRKRRSKDDHQSSKEKRNGGRSSDRDSDGPSSSKRPHVSPQTSNGDYSTQQTSQDSSTLNSEGSSGYSGNSDKAEDQHEEATNKAFMEMQRIKVPKFASNLNEAMKIMKIRKLLKKLDGVIKTDPQNSEVQFIMGEIDELTKDIKREKEEQEEHGDENEETDENQKAQASKSTPVNIDEFISSSNISMAKWNALEAKFMEQITDVDYNSYESPYMDEEEASFETKDEKTLLVSEVSDRVEQEKSLIYEMAEAEEKASNENLDELEENLYSNINKSIVNSNVSEDYNEKVEDINIGLQDQNTPNDSNVTAYVSEQPALSKSTDSQAINVEEVESKDVGIDDVNPRNFKDFKQRAIVLLRKHALTEEMIKNKENLECEADPVTETTNTVEIEEDNIKDELEEVENSQLLENSVKNDDEILDVLDKEETISREHTENNLVVEETISQDIDIYSLQNSCEVCLDSKGDVCKGLERSNNRSLNFIQCIINILENEISIVKETNLEFYSKKHENEDQTRKRKVIDWKTDVSNNNFENSASKRLEVEETKTNPKKLLPTTKKIHPRTNSKTTTKFGHAEQEHMKEMNLGIKSPEMKSGRQSGVNCNAPERVENQVNTKTNRSADKSSEKKIRASQRYSSEDLYKPRIYLRRTGRDVKNP